ncbi:MAG: nucleotidyltransferase domain-containing protein [Bradyrhizobium sp.]
MLLKGSLQERGVTNLAMFGSRARGDHHRASDLDLLVDVREGKKFSLLDLIGISQIISDKLGVPATLFMRRSLEPEMADNIRLDVIEVFHD